MNTPRKNHDIFSCLEAPTPRNEVEVIALKSILLYCLKCFLAHHYEEEEGSFIDFSQNRKARSLSEPFDSKDRDLSWHRIPLQKRCSATEVLYVSALPQLFKQGLRPRIGSDNGCLTGQETTCRFIKQLQIFQRKPLINDSICTAETLSVFSNLWQSFKIESERPGWISFRLSLQGIYAWINQFQDIGHLADPDHTLVIKNPLSKPRKNSSTLRAVNQKQQGYAKAHIDELIWQAQYTHARGCSLMRSWNAVSTQREVLGGEDRIARQAEDLSTLQLVFDATQQTTPTHQLIQSLIEAADDMFWVPERYPRKQYPHKQSALLLNRAEQLTLAFDRFHKSQALIPNASQQFPYATLLNCTCSLMRLLLRRYLQVPAPTRL